MATFNQFCKLDHPNKNDYAVNTWLQAVCLFPSDPMRKWKLMVENGSGQGLETVAAWFVLHQFLVFKLYRNKTSWSLTHKIVAGSVQVYTLYKPAQKLREMRKTVQSLANNMKLKDILSNRSCFLRGHKLLDNWTQLFSFDHFNPNCSILGA